MFKIITMWLMVGIKVSERLWSNFFITDINNYEIFMKRKVFIHFYQWCNISVGQSKNFDTIYKKSSIWIRILKILLLQLIFKPFKTAYCFCHYNILTTYRQL